MNTADLKSILHESIENIDDEGILLAIKELAERKYTPETQPRLTAAQIARIEESRRQIAAGEFLTNEQADAIVDKWLNE
jgi:predicted transcriptional regulator